MYRTPKAIAARRRAPWRQADAIRGQLKPATVLLASSGKSFSDTAIRLAAGQADGGRVRVVTIARIHGTSFGLQHPALMPTKKERDAASAIVADAISKLQRAGVGADGEVIITRGTARPFARAARAAGEVQHVIVDGPGAGRYSRWMTGWTARIVRYLLKGLDVTTVTTRGFTIAAICSVRHP